MDLPLIIDTCIIYLKQQGWQILDIYHIINCMSVSTLKDLYLEIEYQATLLN